jgi:hypothetical protein
MINIFREIKCADRSPARSFKSKNFFASLCAKKIKTRVRIS